MAAVEAQFAVDVVEVDLHRADADVEARGNFLVVEPQRDELDDLEALTLGNVSLEPCKGGSNRPKSAACGLHET